MKKQYMTHIVSIKTGNEQKSIGIKTSLLTYTNTMPMINDQQLPREKHSDPEMVSRFSFQLTVGSNMYHRRKRRGLTQTALAKKAQVTQTIISELENGDYNPSTEMITKLANALDIDRSLLTRKDIIRNTTKEEMKSEKETIRMSFKPFLKYPIKDIGIEYYFYIRLYYYYPNLYAKLISKK